MTQGFISVPRIQVPQEIFYSDIGMSETKCLQGSISLTRIKGLTSVFRIQGLISVSRTKGFISVSGIQELIDSKASLLKEFISVCQIGFFLYSVEMDSVASLCRFHLSKM